MDAFKEMYDADISATLAAKVTERVIEQVHEWQNRPIDPLYPIVYLDCIVLKIRQDKRVINKCLYLALGINMDGHKELLGLWLAESEGAEFWLSVLSVLTELKNRGLEDILIACVDGLTCNGVGSYTDLFTGSDFVFCIGPLVISTRLAPFL